MVRFVPPCRPLPRRLDGSFCTVCVRVDCGPLSENGSRGPSVRPMIHMDHSLRWTCQVPW